MPPSPSARSVFVERIVTASMRSGIRGCGALLRARAVMEVARRATGRTRMLIDYWEERGGKEGEMMRESFCPS